MSSFLSTHSTLILRGPVSWVVISEIMPMSARAAGTGLAASTNWMINFCVSLMVPPMLEAITYGTCEFLACTRENYPDNSDIFFVAFMLMGVAYAIWILPETRNVGLEAMDKVFSSKDSTRDAEMMHRIIERLNAEARGERRGSDGYDSKNEKVEIEATESI